MMAGKDGERAEKFVQLRTWRMLIHNRYESSNCLVAYTGWWRFEITTLPGDVEFSSTSAKMLYTEV